MKTKNLLLFIIICLWGCFPVSLSAQEKQNPAGKVETVKWYSFEEAYKLSKKKPKKIFIDMYTDWCGWCKKMDAETFANPTIAKYMNKHFYCVKFDAERRDTVIIDGKMFVNPNPNGKRTTHQLAAELLRGKMSYPSYVFLNEQGAWLTVVAGYQKAQDFEGLPSYFGSNGYLTSTWEEYRATFKGTVK
jgi:thioredoxin-related protein